MYRRLRPVRFIHYGMALPYGRCYLRRQVQQISSTFGEKRHHYVWIMSVRHQCMWRPTVYPGRQASFESAWSGEELNQVGEPSLKLF